MYDKTSAVNLERKTVMYHQYFFEIVKIKIHESFCRRNLPLVEKSHTAHLRKFLNKTEEI